MFTRRHYKAIAEVIRDNTYPDGICPFTVLKKDTFIEAMGNLFKWDNARFKWDKFVEACYNGGDK